MGLRPIGILFSFSAGTSESDVSRCQILTYKERTDRVQSVENLLRGFAKLKNSKNPRKTRKWVGEASPNSDCFFFKFCVFCEFRVVFLLLFNTKKMDRGVGGVWPIRIFLGFLDFF